MEEPECLSKSAAFDRLYQEHGSPIREFLRLWMRNASVADDLPQETFLQFWRSPSAFDPKRGGLSSRVRFEVN